MNAHHNEILPADFAGDSRVWVYQAHGLFFLSEALQIEKMLEEFVQGWKSHGTPVKGYANLFYGQFIVLMADENATGVSGCSTDSSVRIIKSLERQYNVQLFDRLLIAFLVRDKVEALPLGQLPYAFEKGFISEDTLFFNNTVLTKAELEHNWLVPVKDSWLEQKMRKTAGSS